MCLNKKANRIVGHAFLKIQLKKHLVYHLQDTLALLPFNTKVESFITFRTLIFTFYLVCFVDE